MASKDLLILNRGGSALALRLVLPLCLLAGLAALPVLALGPDLTAPMQAFASKALHRIGDNVVSLVSLPLDHTEKFFLLYIVLSFAAGAVMLSREPMGRKALLQRLFPGDIYRHPSARVDYGIVLINRVLTPSVLVTRLFSSAALASWVGIQLTALLGAREPLLAGAPALILFTLLFAVTTDLSDYVQHWLHHRVPLLWEFHKLHHSAEVMTPLTALRNHPVEQTVGSIVSTFFLGLATGLAGYWLMDSPEPVTFFGAQFFMLFFYSCCAVHLRHSHVWLSWSPGWSRLLISPAQHQIHHSSAARHWNKNYGNVLALWDWMFGSLYVPRERESFSVGLPEVQPHPTLLKAYLVPLLGAARHLAAALRLIRNPIESGAD
jgi:sterol desaturase/sphingolipid hydroxylase (fatty acid hydroxylase superfamily)